MKREFQIINADVLDGIRKFADGSVHCVVTSPPYWGLRDYGAAGQIGLERTPEEYTARLVEVFREVRRVLRDDGTLWLNLGDSYYRNPDKGGSGPNGKESEYLGDVYGRAQGARRAACDETRAPIERHSGRVGGGAPGGGHTVLEREPDATILKPKDLVGIPWRVAFALQADGWYLRSDIIWAKPNPMPESVRDRPTKAHEYLFLLSKSERYYYDAATVREASVTNDPRRPYISNGAWEIDGRPNEQRHGGKRREGDDFSSRNRRSVWTIPTKPFGGAHFAVMPTELVDPCVLAGSPEGGTVLDPFAGAGTVPLVAARHGRIGIGIELNPKYAEMARERIISDAPMFTEEIA